MTPPPRPAAPAARLRRRLRPLIAATLALALPALAHAQRRLRHEYVSPELLARFDPARVDAAILGDGPMPDAIRRDGERLDAPGPADPDAPLLREPGDPPPADAPGIYRPSEARPDRKTGVDSPLDYHAIYNPTVAPMRRNVAFDRVEADYRLTVADIPRRRVPLALDRTARPGRELFWGDLRVELQGDDEPLPSVAPDMRLLALRTEPAEAAAGLTVVRDGADNYYLRGPYRGEVRVVFLVDADQAYFSAPVPGNVRLDHQRGPATVLPAQAQAAGERVLTRLGISPELPFDQGLDALVAHFRAFTAGELPASGGDIYEDLALGGVGVCRHRAFAFMITARAAGVPARVVHNEAHAFVEILAPDGRWRRIDLGGEAPRLDIGGGEGRRLHTPAPDPFPKPPAWLNQYSAMLTRGVPPPDRPPVPDPDAPPPPAIGGAPPALGPGAPGPAPDAPGEASADLPGLADTEPADAPGAGPPAASGVADPAATPFTPPSAVPAEVPLPAPPGEAPAPGEPPPVSTGAPVSVRLDLETADPIDVYRGEALPDAIAGRVVDPIAGDGVPGVKVQLYLVPDGPGAAPVAIGPAVPTDADGRFAARVTLPPTLRLGRYRVVAASEQGAAWSAGRSDVQ